MIDFKKYPVGSELELFACDSCARDAGLDVKRPADSGVESWYCECCAHHNIGSQMICKVGDWLSVKPIRGVSRLSHGLDK